MAFKKRGGEIPPDIEEVSTEEIPGAESIPEEPEKEGQEGRAGQAGQGGKDKKKRAEGAGPKLVSEETSADIEKLKAQVEALNQVREVWNEKFSSLSERLGELRSMIAGNERKLNDIDSKSSRAIDIVEEVKPEKLSSEMQKIDVRIEALKSNLERKEEVFNSIIDEMKEIKNQMNVFRGMEGVTKLSDEVKKELITVQKISAQVQVHADKAEQLFLEFRSGAKNIGSLAERVKGIQSSLSSVSKEFEGVKSKMSGFAGKDEVSGLSSNAEVMSKKLFGYEEKMKSVMDDLNNSLSFVSSNRRDLENLQREIMILHRIFGHFKSARRQVKENEADIRKNERRLMEILNVVELFSSRGHRKRIQKIKKRAERDHLGRRKRKKSGKKESRISRFKLRAKQVLGGSMMGGQKKASNTSASKVGGRSKSGAGSMSRGRNRGERRSKSKRGAGRGSKSKGKNKAKKSSRVRQVRQVGQDRQAEQAGRAGGLSK